MNIICIIIIIMSCYPFRDIRASTKCHHLILFLASCLTSPQLFPSPSASLWTDLLHVCLGLPLFRCPCGFQSKTSLSIISCPFLNVCPIQFHFRLLICIDISISSALLQSSSFEITSSQWIIRILRRQRLILFIRHATNIQQLMSFLILFPLLHKHIFSYIHTVNLLYCSILDSVYLDFNFREDCI